MLSSCNEAVFLLRGYAGTGENVISRRFGQDIGPVATKVNIAGSDGTGGESFSAYAGHPAFTIHKKIYRQQSFSNETSNFSVNDNLTTHTFVYRG